MAYEIEPNETRTTANEYTLGETLYGKISSRSDVDCYKVYLHAGHVKFDFHVPQGMR